MGKAKDTSTHTVVRRDAAGHVRTRVTVTGAKAAETVAGKMRGVAPAGSTVEIDPK